MDDRHEVRIRWSTVISNHYVLKSSGLPVDEERLPFVSALQAYTDLNTISGYGNFPRYC